MCFAGYFTFKNFQNSEKVQQVEKQKNENDLKEFNEVLIPLYLKKIGVLKKYFKTEKDQGEMVHFINLSKNWSAKNINDVEIIIELAGYLDQKLIMAMNSLDEKKKSLLIKELEPIERDIRKIDEPYIKQIIENKKSKN